MGDCCTRMSRCDSFDVSAWRDDQTSASGPDRRAEEEAGIPTDEGGKGRHHRGHHHRYAPPPADRLSEIHSGATARGDWTTFSSELSGCS